MHMADALISPSVGLTMWGVSAGLMGYCSKKLQDDLNDEKIPMMGVLGAFVFAAQMINFAIPGTGSSGHIGGGMILAALLGPHAAFLAMAAILTVQALFFGDGGLLALGCNIFNLGFFPCFIGYPLIHQFTVRHPNPRTILAGSMLSAVTALQLGALAVVLETVFSGISQLPFRSFVLLMLPVHLAIGVVEGLMTSGIIGFVWKARPRMIGETLMPASAGSLKKAAAGFLAATVLTGGFLAWFASSHPDGLEWAVEKVTGAETLPDSETAIHRVFSDIQNHTTVLPDYSFPSGTREAETAPAWPAVDSGATVSGLFGALLVLALCFLIAMGVKALNRNRSAPDGKA